MKKALSISWNRRNPTISAKGCGETADLIKKTARRYGVPLMYSRSLVDRAYRSEVNKQVPEECFVELAEIFLSIKR